MLHRGIFSFIHRFGECLSISMMRPSLELSARPLPKIQDLHLLVLGEVQNKTQSQSDFLPRSNQVCSLSGPLQSPHVCLLWHHKSADYTFPDLLVHFSNLHVISEFACSPLWLQINGVQTADRVNVRMTDNHYSNGPVGFSCHSN